MPSLLHMPTRVLLGRGVVDQLGDTVGAYGDTALVVLGGNSARQTGIAGRILASLHERGLRTVVVDGISSNPRVDQIDAAREISRREGCDVVVAVGGGSVIDAGKVIGLCADVESVAELFDPSVLSHRGLPVVAVPTIAGSGAEVTKGAIITDVQRAMRAGIRGEHLFPVIAVVDPSLHASVPAHHAAAAAFDCLTHAVEALVAVGRTPFTDELAGRVIGLVADHLGRLHRGQPTDAAIDDIALASVMSGICVANASTCLPHRLQQAMGAVPEVPISHGRGLAAVYPAWLDQVQTTAPDRLTPVAAALGVEDAVDAIHRVLHQADLHHGLADHGFRHEHIPRLLAGISGNLGNDPTHRGPASSEQLRALYERSMHQRITGPTPDPTTRRNT